MYYAHIGKQNFTSDLVCLSFAAPPAYDDVVTDVNAAPTGSISQPSAPPLEAIAVQYPEGPPGAFLQEEHHPASAAAGDAPHGKAREGWHVVTRVPA